MAGKTTYALATLGALGVGYLAYDFMQFASGCGTEGDPEFAARMTEELEGFEKSPISAANYFDPGDNVSFYHNVDHHDGEPTQMAVQTFRDSNDICMKYRYD